MSDINILLVDDEERFLATTRKLLEKRGYSIETAANGLDALEKLKKRSFHLVLLDVKMPGMDGIATLKRIRREWPQVEVIMLTGHGTVENAVEGVKLGAADYLMKPADIDDITDAIEVALARRQSIDTQTDRRAKKFEKLRVRLFLLASGILLVPYLFFSVTGVCFLNNICHMDVGVRLSYSWICQVDRIVVMGLSGLFILIPLGIWLVSGKLIQRIGLIAEKRDELQFQLFHASKLASIGELATGIAHEINNPLAIVVARCGIVRDLLNPDFTPEPDNQRIVEELDTISEAAFRARRITRQLIDFGIKKELRLVSGNINQLLDNIVDDLKGGDFKLSNIDIIRRYDWVLPEIAFEPVRLKQVFLNLLNNATESIVESGTITIITEKKNENIDISIKDTGVGIPSNQLTQIFKPFYTTKEVGKGTGLSLSVSLSIVEAFGGTIEVQSSVGVGSSFIVSLPICRSTSSM